MRPDLFQAKACSKPMVKDLSGHCTVGVIRVPQLFYKQNAISKHKTSKYGNHDPFINKWDVLG
ncbi:hypothetical protein Hanom_Chr03g00238931 [Helianthus anomalus]